MVAMAYEWGSPDHPHKKDASGNWQVTRGRLLAFFCRVGLVVVFKVVAVVAAVIVVASVLFVLR